MPRSLPPLVTAAALALALTSCGVVETGPRTTEERPVADVTSVELSTPGSLTITRGDDPSLTVTAGEDLLPHLTSEVHDGVLTLDTDDAPWGFTGSVTYALVLPELESLSVAGSGQVDVDRTDSETFDLVIDGSGTVRVADVSADEITVRIAGSGDVELAGTVTHQRATIEGSGSYVADDLTSDEAEIEIAGSGRADVHVTATLDAEIQGSGRVTHTGEARVTSTIDGSGSLREG